MKIIDNTSYMVYYRDIESELMNVNRTIITIKDYNLSDFEKKIKRFNNKLKKYGKDEQVEYSIINEYERKIKLDGYTFVINLIDIEVDDVTVTLNSKHQVIAKIELPTIKDTVVTIYDRDYKVEDFQHIKKVRCDHCGSDRNRKKGFIIKCLETGNLLQVGATCMKDYTEDLAIMDKMSFKTELLSEFDFDELGYMTGMLKDKDWLPIEEVIAYTNRVIGRDGRFISTKDSEWNNEESTKDKVEKEISKGSSLTPEELKKAEMMMDVIKECEIEYILKNNFNVELIDLVKNRYCKIKNLGKGVWTSQLHNKIIEYKEKEVVETVNQYVGEIGEKIERELMSVANVWIETYYGSQCMNKFIDRDGVVFIWWTKKEVNTNNDYIKMKFTVKDHKEYVLPDNGIELQTIIIRVKEIE